MLSVNTVVIDAVDEANSDLGVVISHQHNIKQLLAVWVKFPQASVYIHQCLSMRNKRFIEDTLQWFKFETCPTVECLHSPCKKTSGGTNLFSNV